jgi:hypothetical protein
MTRPTPNLTLVFTLAVTLASTAATATRPSAAFALARTGAARRELGRGSDERRLIVSDDERVDGNAVMADVQRLITSMA